MKKLIWILIIIFIIICAWLVLRFVIGGPEDNWICDDGQWVKHGNPSIPMLVNDCANK